MSLPIGLQLWSIKDELKKDFKGTLRKIAKLGYEGVEFAGYGGLSSLELKELLSELGLKACGSHISLTELSENIDAAIEYSLEIGNKYIICPYAEFNTKQDVLDLAQRLNVIGEKCRAKGLIFGYHNHAHEFSKFDGEYALDLIYKETEGKLVIAEIDTYWVEYAGVNVVDYIKKHRGRCELIYIKDMQIIGDKKESTEVGNGLMNFSSIIGEAEKQGATWLIIEQEYFTGLALESVEISYNSLKKIAKGGC